MTVICKYMKSSGGFWGFASTSNNRDRRLVVSYKITRISFSRLNVSCFCARCVVFHRQMPAIILLHWLIQASVDNKGGGGQGFSLGSLGHFHAFFLFSFSGKETRRKERYGNSTSVVPFSISYRRRFHKWRSQVRFPRNGNNSLRIVMCFHSLSNWFPSPYDFERTILN